MPLRTAELDELSGDVREAGFPRAFRHPPIILPEADGDVRIAACRRRVGHRRRRDDPGREAPLLRLFEDREDPRRLDARVIAAADRLVHAEHSGHRLQPRDHRGHRRGRIRDLGVHVVGLRERHVREGVEGEPMFFACRALSLALQDPRGRHGRDAHAVPDEEDHVLRDRASLDERSGRGDLPPARGEPGVLLARVGIGGHGYLLPRPRVAAADDKGDQQEDDRGLSKHGALQVARDARGSDVEADRAHQFEGVALLHHAGAQTVVELHLPFLEVVLEVDVRHPALARVHHAGEREVVGRHDPEGTVLDEAADHRFRADAAVVGVRSMEDLVEQKERRRLSA